MGKDNRYRKCPVLVLEGMKYLGARAVREYEQRPDDRFHTVREEDRLDILAEKYLGDPRLWWVICDYNGIAFPLQLPPEGTILRIPDYEYVRLVMLE